MIISPDLLETKSYDYTLPPGLIASEPANPKDSSKLMVIDRKSGAITHAVFRDILSFIPKETAIFYNDTKVIKARLFGHKKSGGAIELLLNKQLKDDRFNALIRGRVRAGTLISFDEKLHAKVLKLCEDGSRIVQFLDENSNIVSFEILLLHLEKLGHVPLPPYIQRADTDTDISDYQPVFAQNEGAVAAPTASLHFTEELFDSMKRKFKTYPITLHVGAGTFKPVDTDIITDHPMHSEAYTIPKNSCEILDSKALILAMGTTVTRTIEQYARNKEAFGDCRLFLHPNNKPMRVNYLLTNFHLPKSTLIMLVASFLGLEKTMEAYHEAIKKEYRFYSYGDAMLII